MFDLLTSWLGSKWHLNGLFQSNTHTTPFSFLSLHSDRHQISVRLLYAGHAKLGMSLLKKNKERLLVPKTWEQGVYVTLCLLQKEHLLGCLLLTMLTSGLLCSHPGKLGGLHFSLCCRGVFWHFQREVTNLWEQILGPVAQIMQRGICRCLVA